MLVLTQCEIHANELFAIASLGYGQELLYAVEGRGVWGIKDGPPLKLLYFVGDHFTVVHPQVIHE
jgi:hypothetical protein